MASLTSAIRSQFKRYAVVASAPLSRRLDRLKKKLIAVRRENRRLRRDVDRLLARREGRRVASGRAMAPTIPPAQIRAARAREGLSRLAFSRLVGVSPGSIFLWETGRAVPRAHSLERLQRVMGGARRSGAGAAATKRRKTGKRGRRSAAATVRKVRGRRGAGRRRKRAA